MAQKSILGYIQRIERMSEGESTWIEITMSFHIPTSYEPGDEGERVREALNLLHLGIAQVDQKT